MKHAEVYSFLVDECKDSSKTEQLSFVLRYVDLGTGDICERFSDICRNIMLRAFPSIF